MSGWWFQTNFHVESFFRSIVQKSHINRRSDLSGELFHEWAVTSSKFSCREFHETYSTKNPHQAKKWAVWRPFSWVGDDFVQIVISRVSWDLKYKRATSFTEVSYLETILMRGRWIRPIFPVESFFRSIVQKRYINHRSELSGDHYHEWALLLPKISNRDFLEIYSTKEPHQSQKWAICRPISLVGDDFVQFFISRVSWDLNTREPHHSQKWAIWRPFHAWAMISSKFSCREFLEIYCTREPHQSQKWAIWRPFSLVGDDFVQFFISRVSWDPKYKRATSFTEVNYLETTFKSGRWFRPNFHVESFFRSIGQKSHIIHRSELSGDHFHECAMISSKFSCREFLEVYNTREPLHSQKWANWRPFSWVGDVFVQKFMPRVYWDL